MAQQEQQQQQREAEADGGGGRGAAAAGAEDGRSIATLEVWFGNLAPSTFGRYMMEACTSIGLRQQQEDRLVVCPRLFEEDQSFLGVFDGTVGDAASDFAVRHILQHFVQTQGFADLRAMQARLADGSSAVLAKQHQAAMVTMTEHMQRALIECFQTTDQALIEMCAEQGLHYASSTGVVVCLWNNMLSVAHVGDSKASMAKMVNGRLVANFITHDHKPNQPEELRRIEASGGSLAYLHGNKPYIRGGDFFERQRLGHHPKQLNYSRAFGGKDLKMYGLSVLPDVSHFPITAEDRLLLIASDGLWDVLDAQTASEVCFNAMRQKRHATSELARKAIDEMPERGVRDNITILAVYFNTEGGRTHMSFQEHKVSAAAPAGAEGAAMAAGAPASAAATVATGGVPASPVSNRAGRGVQFAPSPEGAGDGAAGSANASAARAAFKRAATTSEECEDTGEDYDQADDQEDFLIDPVDENGPTPAETEDTAQDGSA